MYLLLPAACYLLQGHEEIDASSSEDADEQIQTKYPSPTRLLARNLTDRQALLPRLVTLGG